MKIKINKRLYIDYKSTKIVQCVSAARTPTSMLTYHKTRMVNSKAESFSHEKLRSGQVLFGAKFRAKSGKSEQLGINTNKLSYYSWNTFYMLRFFH